MIFDIIDPGLNPVPMWWATGITIAMLVVVVLGIWGAIVESDGDIFAGAFTVALFVSALTWVILGGGVAGSEKANTIYDLKVAGIESLGFTEVTLADDRFTASNDGEFFGGLLVEIDTNRFQILELTNAVR